ncbi:MAG: hypothetical protein AMJ79_00080 [Phycisphaerae bacterium SM23_30]|nr:MAG: hypothetical protein AMJ79_00080 [Phycisphaerae bacterium SM23_30]
MPHRIGRKYSAIGLDLGRTAIRGVQLMRQGKSLNIHAALEVSVVESYGSQFASFVEPEVDKSCLADKLKRLLGHGDFIGRDVMVHCPADKLDLRPVKLPAAGSILPRQAVLGVLRLQMGSHLPFPVEQAVFDYFRMDSDPAGNTLRVMAITADGAWIKQRIKLVESQGLHCLGVDALPCVLARVSLGADSSKEKELNREINNCDSQDDEISTTEILIGILDIGFSGSTLVVRNSQNPIFCRRFSLAGLEMNSILTQRLGVNFGIAENLKRSYGLDCQTRQLRTTRNGSDQAASMAAEANDKVATGPVVAVEKTDEQKAEVAKTIYAALQSELGHFVKGLTRSLNYVITDHGSARLGKIVLCGSAAHTKNLEKFLTQQFELPVEIIRHPLLTEIAENLPASRAQVGSWATALGLALSKEMA